MSANTQPIFPVAPVVGFGKITTANIAKDGTGAQVNVLVAGVNGTRVDSLKVRSLGTNVATVVRVFINNGGDSTIATNNTLYKECTIAATTVSEISELIDNVIDMSISIPAGYKINCTIGTSVAAGVQVTCVGGNY